jgi:uncharacterized protein YqeY
MSLAKKIDDDIIIALKAGEKLKLTVLRGLKSDIKYKVIEKGDDLKEDEIVTVLSSAAKKRRDSIEQFKAGNRADLVDKETSELEIINGYLPEQLSEEKLRELIAESIESTGADSPAKLGLVMKETMAKVRGKADGKLVNRLAAEMLAGDK